MQVGAICFDRLICRKDDKFEVRRVICNSLVGREEANAGLVAANSSESQLQAPQSIVSGFMIRRFDSRVW